ncbi:MAG: hypothetical protein AAFV26_09940, partial [Pseudomonadota bacterium]
MLKSLALATAFAAAFAVGMSAPKIDRQGAVTIQIVEQAEAGWLKRKLKKAGSKIKSAAKKVGGTAKKAVNGAGSVVKKAASTAKKAVKK